MPKPQFEYMLLSLGLFGAAVMGQLYLLSIPSKYDIMDVSIWNEKRRWEEEKKRMEKKK